MENNFILINNIRRILQIQKKKKKGAGWLEI